MEYALTVQLNYLQSHTSYRIEKAADKPPHYVDIKGKKKPRHAVIDDVPSWTRDAPMVSKKNLVKKSQTKPLHPALAQDLFANKLRKEVPGNNNSAIDNSPVRSHKQQHTLTSLHERPNLIQA